MATYQLDIYTRPACSDCQELKAFLNKHAIAYQSHEVANNNENEQDLIRMTGNRIVPALVLTRKGLFQKKTVLIGFERNRQKLASLLQIK